MERDEILFDLILPTWAHLIREQAKTSMLIEIVGEIVDQMQLRHVKGVPLSDWMKKSFSEKLESSIAAFSQGSAELEKRLRKLLDGMEHDDFHLGNGRPH